MKKLLLVMLSIISLSAVANNKNLKDKVEKKKSGPIISLCFYLEGEIGRKDRNCKGFGFGCLKIITDVEVKTTPAPGHIYADVKMLNGNTLNFIFTPEKDEIINQEFIVESGTSQFFQNAAKKLGYSSILLLEGKYRVSSLSDGRLSVDLKVITK
jgi:hypothetical protein